MVYFEEIDITSLCCALNIYGIEINEVPEDILIPYSYWGTPEAGRKNNTLYVRCDTPVHSILHETCHFVCMPEKQRLSNNIDAAGSSKEENASCYLQILLSDHIGDFTREMHMQNMDEWGYSFRLGSATAWFYQDAEDAKKWLQDQMIIDQYSNITWKLRK